MTGRPKFVISVAMMAVWSLAGCAAIEATQQLPPQAQSMMSTIEAPPHGRFDCGFPLGDTVYGRARGLTLEPEGGFDFFHQDDEGDGEQGQWDFAADLHQIGFSGETSLDYGYYDIGAKQLILFMKPAEDGQVFNLHCLREEGDASSQP